MAAAAAACQDVPMHLAVLTRPAILSHIFKYVGDSVKKVGALAAVSSDFRDTIVNFAPDLWLNVVKKDDGTQYAKLINIDCLAYAIAAQHDKKRLGNKALDLALPWPSAKEPVEPLADATLRNKPQIVRALLAMGADPTGKDKQGNAMIIIASLANNVEVIRPYLERNPELAKTQHHTFGKNFAVHFTVQTGNEAGTRLLIDNGADPRCRGDGGFPPIVYAARYPNIIKYLVDEKKVDIDDSGRDGRTALHDAAMQGCDASVKALLERGANINKLDKEKRTPLDITSNPTTVELLKSKGAKRGKELTDDAK